MDVAASANRSTEAGGDFVIAQIDVCAATGTIGRRRLIADFMFALALETGNDAIALAAPDCFQLLVKRHFLMGRGIILKLERRLGCVR